MKIRLDAYLHQKGFFNSRTEARAAVMEGLVTVDRNPNVKPGTQINGTENIEVKDPGPSFVSRGGLKLQKALDSFRIDVGGKTALDVGSSTGGFTDCLLKSGASSVIAVDVGKGQLHWRLRNDTRVRVMEGVNARYLKPGDLPEEPQIVTVDVSFISLTKVLEPVFKVAARDVEVIALVKPQFEAGKGKVGKGGVVRDASTHIEVLTEILCWAGKNGISVVDAVESPVKGPKGNMEFFLHLSEGSTGSVDVEKIKLVVCRAHRELG